MTRMIWGFACLVLFLVTAMLLALQVEPFLKLDNQLLGFLHLAPGSSFTEIASWLRAAFNFWPSMLWLVGLVVAAGYWWGHEASIELAILGVGVLFFSRFEKIVFLRGRPDSNWQLVPVTGFSFPSAHALRSTGLIACALAIGWAYLSQGQRKTLATLGVLLCFAVGLAELLLAANYPSDVLAGICLGLAWALGISALWTLRRTTAAI